MLMFGSYRIDERKPSPPRVSLQFDNGELNIYASSVKYIEGALPPRKLGEVIKQARQYSFDFLDWKRQFVLRQHWLVHTRRSCPDCGGPLSKTYPGTTRRRTFFCPVCQVRYGAVAAVRKATSTPRKAAPRRSARSVRMA
jgi:endonuclease-8